MLAAPPIPRAPEPAAPPQTEPPARRPRIALGRVACAVEWLGHAVRGALEWVGSGARFAAEVAVSLRDVRTWSAEVLLQARRLGVDSLPLVLFIALFTGIVLALLANYSFTRAVPSYFVGTLVEKTVTMELAPVLSGLALAGRVGASIAAELGTMKVTEQIDALETLAYDPLAFLVVPRVLAATMMFPVVVALAMVLGVAAGWGASIMMLELSTTEYVRGVRLFFGSFDVRYGLVKAGSFGLVVTLIAARSGLTARGGAEGVGRATTRAVVLSAVAILLLDAVWAVTWLLGRDR